MPSVQTQPGIVYQFGSFEVNAASGELLKNGRRIKLQEQPYRLLVASWKTPVKSSAGRNFEAASGVTIRSLILTAAFGWRFAN